MQPIHSSTALTLGRAVRKLFLSAFVIFTFLIYAVHERLAGSTQTAAAGGLAATYAPTTVAVPAVVAPTAAGAPNPTVAPLSQDASSTTQPAAATVGQPTALPPSPTAAGQYKDGQYTGPQIDAFYGWVQVQATIQNGQISDVKFLQYPSDRRTSQRINSIAMPYLTTEAIQAQSANVDIISGATLTSQAFAQSLQAALQNAAP